MRLDKCSDLPRVKTFRVSLLDAFDQQNIGDLQKILGWCNRESPAK